MKVKTIRQVNDHRMTSHQLAYLLLNAPDLPVGVEYDHGDTYASSFLFSEISVTHEITHGNDEILLIAMAFDPTQTEAAMVAAGEGAEPAQYVASTL